VVGADAGSDERPGVRIPQALFEIGPDERAVCSCGADCCPWRRCDFVFELVSFLTSGCLRNFARR
jgi:hypothetical protein